MQFPCSEDAGRRARWGRQARTVRHARGRLRLTRAGGRAAAVPMRSRHPSSLRAPAPSMADALWLAPDHPGRYSRRIARSLCATSLRPQPPTHTGGGARRTSSMGPTPARPGRRCSDTSSSAPPSTAAMRTSTRGSSSTSGPTSTTTATQGVPDDHCPQLRRSPPCWLRRARRLSALGVAMGQPRGDHPPRGGDRSDGAHRPA